MFHGGEELELARGRQEAGLDAVGGELPHLLRGEVELPLDEDVLVEERGAEHGRVVGVDGQEKAFFEVTASRMLGGRWAAAGAEVGGEVDLDGDLALGEDLHQVRVMLGGQAVADALGADVQGGPDAGGTVDGTGGLAGVRGEVEAGGSGLGEELAEGFGGPAGFIAADADAGDRRVLDAEFRGQAEDFGGLLQAEVADRVKEPEDSRAGLAFGTDAGGLHGLHDGAKVKLRLEAQKDPDGDVDLRVDHTLGGEREDHLAGDEGEVIRGLEALGDGLEGHQEGLKVGIGIERAGLGQGEGLGVVALGQDDQGLGRDSAFKVQMKLSLGQTAEPCGEVGLSSFGADGHLFSVRRSARMNRFESGVRIGLAGMWLGLTLVSGMSWAGAQDAPPVPEPPVPEAALQVPPGLPLTGAVGGVHDASMVKQGSTWYVFGSGGRHGQQQLPIRCSEDMLDWRPCGFVFDAIPAWIRATMPGIHELWAPDISYEDGEYRLYYAYSRVGLNTSGIALAVTPTLNAADPRYGWVDRGLVLASAPGDDFNAIDPGFVQDDGGQAWLVYGSVWGGIKMRRLGADGLLDPADAKVVSLARRKGGLFGGPSFLDDALEGSYLVRHDGFWYLFASWDHCCLGTASNYRVMVGRADSIEGPYVDASGRKLLKGGGTEVVAGDAQWAGPGGERVWVGPAGTAWLVQAMQEA